MSGGDWIIRIVPIVCMCSIRRVEIFVVGGDSMFVLFRVEGEVRVSESGEMQKQQG